MAIESVIELRINGIEQLDELERRLEGLRDGSINLAGGGGGGSASTTNVTINEYNTHTQTQQRNELHAFSRGLHMATSTIGGLTTSFVKLSKAIIGTGGLLSGVTSMATIAGMLKTAQNINQAAFMTNASGMNPNDLNRLKATYGQIFNVESVTSALAREKAAPYSMLMTQMGLSQQQAQSMSTEELMKRVSGHAKMMAQQYGANELALKAGGLEGVMSVDDLLRELNIKPGQQATIGGLAEKYRGITQLERPEEWQRFSSMMSLGTQAVGTKMENLLRPLLDPLFNVFDSFFDRVFGPKNQQIWEDAIGIIRNGMVQLADFIKTGTWEELKDKLQNTFGKSLDKASNFITEKFHSALETLDNSFRLFGLNMSQLMDSFKAFGYALEGVTRVLFEEGGPLESWKQEHGFGLRQWKKQVDDAYNFAKGAVPEMGHRLFDDKILEVANKTGLNPALLFGLTQQESRFNPKAVSSKGAMGLGQAMRGTWAQYGKGDPFDPNASLDFEGAYLLALHKMLGGGTTEMLAGYNAGPGAVLKAKKKAGRLGAEDWTEYLPLETRNYIKSVMENEAAARKAYRADPMTGNMSRPLYGNTRVDVNVNSPASADTTVQTSRTPGAPNTGSK